MGCVDCQGWLCPPGDGAIERRCIEQVSRCIEAQANLLPAEGQDLTVEALYRILFRDDETMEIDLLATEANCVRSTLQLNASNQTALTRCARSQSRPCHGYKKGGPKPPLVYSSPYSANDTRSRPATMM